MCKLDVKFVRRENLMEICSKHQVALVTIVVWECLIMKLHRAFVKIVLLENIKLMEVKLRVEIVLLVCVTVYFTSFFFLPVILALLTQKKSITYCIKMLT